MEFGEVMSLVYYECYVFCGDKTLKKKPTENWQLYWNIPVLWLSVVSRDGNSLSATFPNSACLQTINNHVEKRCLRNEPLTICRDCNKSENKYMERKVCCATGQYDHSCNQINICWGHGIHIILFEYII